MKIIDVKNILYSDHDSNILYQKNFSADFIFQDDDGNELECISDVMIEMTPVHFNYYVKKIHH